MYIGMLFYYWSDVEVQSYRNVCNPKVILQQRFIFVLIVCLSLLVYIKISMQRYKSINHFLLSSDNLKHKKKNQIPTPLVLNTFDPKTINSIGEKAKIIYKRKI